MKNSILHAQLTMRRTWFNRVIAVVNMCSIVTILRYRVVDLFRSRAVLTSILMLTADIVFAIVWFLYQSFRMKPIRREVFIENLPRVVKDERDYPALDVFICTADPHKEPPIGVVNTALSAMAFDYPTDKLSVYVSDDGGSELTLFAFMEAAKFSKYWLPFCKKNGIVDRCPHAYFESNLIWSPEFDDIMDKYENMKTKINNVVKLGRVNTDDISNDESRQAFSKWTSDFTSRHHPAVIQILSDNKIDKDNTGHTLPKLIYVAREKSRQTHHNFKAGALNVLLRVSAIISNAPIFLTLDCDMYSNDPTTPLRALCYFLDPMMDEKLGWMQFPQLFNGVNKYDIYASEMKLELKVNPLGLDGLLGVPFVGTGAFFRRKIFFGGPFSDAHTELLQVTLNNTDILTQAHNLAGCSYETQTKWGSEVGFLYGSIAEDAFTSYRLHCLGWKSVFCNPKRGAFLGNAPSNLYDILTQMKRWSFGLIEIFFSKYNPLTYGIRRMNILQCFSYALMTLMLAPGIPTFIYAFLPQLTLINSYFIFPKASESTFFVYIVLFTCSIIQSLFEYMIAEGTFKGWWNSQRMSVFKGISSYPFALFEFVLKYIGISSFGFNVTSKVAENYEENKRYNQGMYEFGVSSPIFVPLAMTAILNLFSLYVSVIRVSKNMEFGDSFAQICISGYFVACCWPVYGAMFLRRDKGKMPFKITLIAIFLSFILCKISSFAFSP